MGWIVECLSLYTSTTTQFDYILVNKLLTSTPTLAIAACASHHPTSLHLSYIVQEYHSISDGLIVSIDRCKPSV